MLNAEPESDRPRSICSRAWWAIKHFGTHSRYKQQQPQQPQPQQQGGSGHQGACKGAHKGQERVDHVPEQHQGQHGLLEQPCWCALNVETQQKLWAARGA
jgi:hypothetical protein